MTHPRAAGNGGPTAAPPRCPPVATPASDHQITLGRLAIVLTLLAWAAYILVTVISQFVNRGFQGMRFTSETVIYVVIMSFLTFSSLMYLVARQGSLYRSRAHRRVPRAVIDDSFDTSLPTMTVLVPSYREEVGTVRKTLLSAALQEYPYLRIVLLLDDPPHPTAPEHIASLARARGLAAELTDWLAAPRTRFAASLEQFERATLAEGDPTHDQMAELATHYAWAAGWLNERADDEPIEDHVDVFFADQVLRNLATDFTTLEQALLAAIEAGVFLPRARMLQLHRRLAWTFRAEITWFERKLYASLSHESNKAMNINSYLGLMGRSFNPGPGASGGLVLAPAANSGSIVIPDADYVLTLDADSVLLPEYCLRLVHLMQLPENARLAIAQTPYSAIPGSATRIERLAGGTTDLQHIVHQGMGYHDATFWVGANAVIRKRALEDIVETETDGEREIRRYVQDRTVIEDTESSLDLAIHGWRLFNYPERLSYSATPPDFGALSIQRRRWGQRRPADPAQADPPRPRADAPGRTRLDRAGLPAGQLPGLDLLELARPGVPAGLPLRQQAAQPVDPAGRAALLPRHGQRPQTLRYKRTDILRIYGFNLILLPVNLAGVVKSLQQAITGKKIPFARTPKVRDRTATAPLFTLSPLLIIVFSIYSVWRDVHDPLHRNWGNAAFASVNALAAAYAVVAFVGLRPLVVDTWLGLLEHLYVTEKPARADRARRRSREPVAATTAQLPWDEVLYRGAAATASGAHLTESAGTFRVLASAPGAGPSVGTAPAEQIV